MPPRIKSAEQLTPEELQRALPSATFAASSLLWSTLLASGVAAAGLVTIVYLGTWIVGAAGALRAQEAAPAAPPPKPKSLAELIAERKVRDRRRMDAALESVCVCAAAFVQRPHPPLAPPLI